jgi:precorrin-6B methylase 1
MKHFSWVQTKVFAKISAAQCVIALLLQTMTAVYASSLHFTAISTGVIQRKARTHFFNTFLSESTLVITLLVRW